MAVTIRRQYRFQESGSGAHLLLYVAPFISQPSTSTVSAAPSATSLPASR